MLLKSLMNYACPLEACASPSPGLLFSGAVPRVSGLRGRAGRAVGLVAIGMECGASFQPLDRRK